MYDTEKTEEPGAKDANLVVCKNIGDDDEVVTYTKTHVALRYTGETDIVDNNETCHHVEIPEVVASEAMKAVANRLCSWSGGGGGNSNGGDGGNSTRNRERRLSDDTFRCVISVSLGPAGYYDGGTCETTLEKSVTCDTFTDQFSVLHTDDCGQSEVLAAARTFLEETFESDELLEVVNGQVDCVATSYEVTNIDLLADPNAAGGNIAAGATSAMVMENGGLTPGGKFVVFLAVAATVLLAILGLAWRRHMINRRRRMEDDLKSIRTDWSNPTNDDNSYLQPDFHDLALRHSKQNVHRCNSAFCRTCRPNLGVVHMLSVSKDDQQRQSKELQLANLSCSNKKNSPDEFQICGTIDEAPETLCAVGGCISDDEDADADVEHVPEQVAFSTAKRPFSNQKKSNLNYPDPLEQPPPPEPLGLNESYRSDLTEDAGIGPALPLSSPAVATEQTGSKMKKRNKQRKGRIQQKEQQLQSPLEYDETEYSFYDNDTNNDGFTFVRIANAKRAADIDAKRNCTGEPSQEVVL